MAKPLKVELKFSTLYRPWEAADLSGDRPVLSQVLFCIRDGKALAVAADGYILAVVPVSAEPTVLEDTLIPGYWLADIAKASRKRKLPQVVLTIADGSVTWKEDELRRIELSSLPGFPDWEGLLDCGEERVIPHLAVSAELLDRLGKALGGPQLRVRFHGLDKPVSVESLHDPEAKGAAMPLFVFWPEMHAPQAAAAARA
jgi:hypothetical protein